MEDKMKFFHISSFYIREHNVLEMSHVLYENWGNFYDDDHSRVREITVIGERKTKNFHITDESFAGDTDIWKYDSECGNFHILIWWVDDPISHIQYVKEMELKKELKEICAIN